MYMTMTPRPRYRTCALGVATITTVVVGTSLVINNNYGQSLPTTHAHAYASSATADTATAYEDPTVVSVYVVPEHASGSPDPVAQCLLAHGYVGNPNDQQEAIYGPANAIAECTTEVA